MVFHAWFIAPQAVDGGAILWWRSPKPWPTFSLSATAVGSQSPHALKWGLVQLQSLPLQRKTDTKGDGGQGGEIQEKETHVWCFHRSWRIFLLLLNEKQQTLPWNYTALSQFPLRSPWDPGWQRGSLELMSVRTELENGHKAQSICCQGLRLKLLMYRVGEWRFSASLSYLSSCNSEQANSLSEKRSLLN